MINYEITVIAIQNSCTGPECFQDARVPGQYYAIFSHLPNHSLKTLSDMASQIFQFPVIGICQFNKSVSLVYLSFFNFFLCVIKFLQASVFLQSPS